MTGIANKCQKCGRARAAYGMHPGRCVHCIKCVVEKPCKYCESWDSVSWDKLACHPTSCCSIAEIMSVLFFNTMRYKVSDPKNPANDRFVLSKGHAAPILYAVWAELGLFPEAELLNLRSVHSDLEGMPCVRLSFVDVTTGSLGIGLGVAAGMAYTAKYFDRANYRVYCVVGDGESAEGSIWEALHFSSLYKLDNLVAILDVNRLGQTCPTPLQHDFDAYQKRLEAFGWHTIIVDGHNVESLCMAFHQASTITGKPCCLIAKTFKGCAIPGVEDEENWHGKPLGTLTADETIRQLTSALSKQTLPVPTISMPTQTVIAICISELTLSEPPCYEKGQKVMTRAAFGCALVKLGRNSECVIALDAECSDSTHSEMFKHAFPHRFIECYISEQNLVAVAMGCAARDRCVAFVSTFSAFLTRAYDQIRIAAISASDINIVGSHGGVAISSDGPCQMGLQDLAFFRSLPGSTVFYPSDAVSAERAVELAANTRGVCFIRTSRPNTAVIYDNDESFHIGKAKIVRESASDVVTVIGAGITLHEALTAADRLAEIGIHICVIDVFTVKPIDKSTILHAANRTAGRIITVEDHYAEGGIGEAVSSALSEERNITVRRLAVNGVPRSGTCAELLHMFAIDASSIVNTVQKMISV